MAEGKPDRTINRRDFLKYSAAAAGFVFGLNPSKIELSGGQFETFRGQVNDGESLTTATERVSGRRENSWSTFSMVWKNPQTDCDYYFTNKQAFRYQGKIPLPFVQPGDEIAFGTEYGMKEKLNEPGLFTSKDRVTIDSNVKKDGDKIETHLTVFGGRFDRTVFYMLDDQGDAWRINTKGNDWVDSEKFKDLMDTNPDMKSSEALAQL